MTRSARSICCAILPLLLAPTPPLYAQDPDIVVRGRVTDPQGHPIARARIAAVAGIGDSRLGVTGADGRYAVVVPARFTAALRVSAEGYRSVLLDAVAYGSAPLDIVLEPAPFRLAAVSVTGRTRPEIAAIPGAVSVAGQSVLRERAPISVMDALRTIPGVHTADEDPYGLNLNVGFRGLPPRRSSRTLLLEDGVPILLGPYGDPSMHYAPPVEALDRIEVLRGSGQLMNGPQTVGGVINFVTRRPPDTGTHGIMTIGAGGHGYRNAHVWAGTAHNASGAAVDYTYREGGGVRREQGHRFHNALLSTVLAPAAGHSLLVKGSVWDESSRISETGLTQEEFETDPFSLPFSRSGTFDVRRYAGQVVHEMGGDRRHVRTSAYVSSTRRASWRQSGESEERLGEDDYAEAFNCPPDATSYEACGNQGRPREYRVAGIEPRISMEVGRGETAATLAMGGRLYHESARRRQFTGNTPVSRENDAVLTHDNEIATNAVAGYVHARVRLGPGALSPGLRVEHLAQTVSNRFPGREAAVDIRMTQLLPGLGATYALRPGATLFAGVHRGFAPPRPADVYRPEPGQPVVLVDPETSWNWEIGGRVEPLAGVSAEATLFRMDFGNQIIEAPAATGQRFTNGGSAVHQGAELAGHISVGTLRGSRDDLTLSAAVTYVPVARFSSDDERGSDIAGNRLPYAPRALASVSATFAHRTGLTFGGSLEYTGEQFADAENTIEPAADGQRGVLPSYSVLHAFASYAIPGTRLQIRTSARNVLDAVYVTQRNEGIYTGMRRLARAEVQWSFQE